MPAEADDGTAEPAADEEDDRVDDDGFFDDALGSTLLGPRKRHRRDIGFGAWPPILDEVHRIIEDRSESGKVLLPTTAFEM